MMCVTHDDEVWSVSIIQTTAQCRSSAWNFPVVSFYKIFSIQNTHFQERLSVFYSFIFSVSLFFMTAMCQVRIYSLCFCLFQKFSRPVFFSTRWLLLIVINKFANRNSCGYLLDVLENSHGNVCSEVLVKVVRQHAVC